MADNYTRGSQTFRSEDKSNVHFPVTLVGALPREYVGVQSITATTASQTLTVPATAEFADIYCQGTASTDLVRYWHGSTPTATVGNRLKDHEVLQSAAPSSFNFILGSGAGSTVLRVEYYRYI